MGKSTISMAIFNGYVNLPEGICPLASKVPSENFIPSSVGFLRSGVHADYNFYKRYTEETWAVVLFHQWVKEVTFWARKIGKEQIEEPHFKHVDSCKYSNLPKAGIKLPVE